MIIDAADMIVGRMGTVVAKKALLGETIDIVNCEKAIITGKRSFLISEFNRRQNLGTFKGPFLPKMPDRFVKRIIRGMLPYKNERGLKAFKRIKCHIGVPDEFNGKEMSRIKEAHISKVKNLDYMNIAEICRSM